MPRLEREWREQEKRRISHGMSFGPPHWLELLDLRWRLCFIVNQAASMAQIEYFLRRAKARLRTLLEHLSFREVSPDIAVIQKPWFLGHGEHPPKLLTAAIPACF
jgi:hypothetical protein